MKVLSYCGIITKEEFVNEMRKHQLADNFEKGFYWMNQEEANADDRPELANKGCAVGCSLESISRLKGLHLCFCDHDQYPRLLGIPTWLAKVEDKIFEGLSIERSKSWPVEFSEAVPVGVDLNQIKKPFLICILKILLTAFDNLKYSDVTKSINNIIELIKNDAPIEDLMKARKAAYAAYAAYAADAAARKKTWEYFAEELLKLIKECK